MWYLGGVAEVDAEPGGAVRGGVAGAEWVAGPSHHVHPDGRLGAHRQRLRGALQSRHVAEGMGYEVGGFQGCKGLCVYV